MLSKVSFDSVILALITKFIFFTLKCYYKIGGFLIQNLKHVSPYTVDDIATEKRKSNKCELNNQFIRCGNIYSCNNNQTTTSNAKIPMNKY